MEKRKIIQQISTICDDLPTKMKWAKEEQHKTNQQIIDSTGLSESMVKKLFSGHLSGPSIYDVTAIAIDLGLSLDALMELSPPKQDQNAQGQTSNASTKAGTNNTFGGIFLFDFNHVKASFVKIGGGHLLPI